VNSYYSYSSSLIERYFTQPSQTASAGVSGGCDGATELFAVATEFAHQTRR